MLQKASVFAIVFGLLFSLFPTVVKATALTYNVASNEQACFYLWNDKPGKKIGFYFAVQQGGAFDIDYKVTAPNQEVVLEGEEEKEGDYVFTATQFGEYSFCFSNDKSTWTDKLLDFELLLESEQRPQFNTNDESEPKVAKMEESLSRINGYLTAIQRSQKYFRSRENRNSATVNSTESRIVWFAVLESMGLITMAALQVFVIKNFFNVKRGGV